ncbi:MAG TPA: iron ABC transporter permease [Gemmatimonadaceae bacterium]|nr:iron ABC transporter permease [Gemmatimonadaceae bacterium]
MTGTATESRKHDAAPPPRPRDARGRPVWFWLGAGAALVVLGVAGIAFGAVPLALPDVLAALRGEGDASAVAIVRTLRLPRVMLAALVGAALGLSGGALQGALRNPLAEPWLLGVSGGAAVGAVGALALGVSAALVPLAAFAGAAAAVAVALAVAGAAGGRGDPRVLLMAGVVVGAFANAVIMIALATAPADTVRGALWWMMGSVADADWSQVRWVAATTLIGGGALIVLAREIDVLSLGEEPAAALGVAVDAAARRIYLLASLLAAATVTAAGLVGFVGLVVPHIARAAGLRGHRALLPASALTGAALVIAADLLARTVRAPIELPLGAVTALVGVPFFLARLRRLA